MVLWWVERELKSNKYRSWTLVVCIRKEKIQTYTRKQSYRFLHPDRKGSARPNKKWPIGTGTAKRALSHTLCQKNGNTIFRMKPNSAVIIMDMKMINILNSYNSKTYSHTPNKKKSICHRRRVGENNIWRTQTSKRMYSLIKAMNFPKETTPSTIYSRDGRDTTRTTKGGIKRKKLRRKRFKELKSIDWQKEIKSFRSIAIGSLEKCTRRKETKATWIPDKSAKN